MRYNLNFDISAVCISAVLLIAFYYKRRSSAVAFKSRMFELLAWSGGLASVADILSCLANNADGMLTAKWLTNMAYFMFHSATALFSVLYFIFMAEPMVKMPLRRKLQLYLPYAVEIVLIAFNPLLRIFFYFDSDGKYQRGGFLWICYAIYVYYFLYMVIFVLKKSDFFNTMTQVIVVGTSSIYIIPLLIQLLKPTVLIECFFSVLFIMIVYVVYQTNDNSIDSTTRLLSWQVFESDCKAYITSGQNFSVLMIRLRDSKFISDLFGAQFCSKVYIAFASFISKYVSQGNAYSFGGGVFALCFINESSDPRLVMDSLSERMQEPWGFEEMTTKLSVSMSIISFPVHASSYNSFMELADSILIVDDSRPGVIYADEVAVKDKRRKSNIEKVLVSDHVYRDIEIFYQPIFSEKGKRFEGLEALVRLRDPILGYIMPDEFIPLAEKNGSMIHIGEHIFENVCKFISQNDLESIGIRMVAVNLSVIQCMQTDLVSEIASIMQKYNVNPMLICFEISELAATNPPDIMTENISALNSLGVSFSLDNYGVGLSGLQQLMLMPIRYIKFDSGFIKSALTSERGSVLLKSSMYMSRSMNLKVVAEGVEDSEIARQVKELGFDYYQGYYMSPVCKAVEAVHRIKVLNANLAKTEPDIKG